MAYSVQSKIWSFITAYKRVTQQELYYLELIQDQDAFQNILDSVSHFNDIELQQSIRDVQALIDEGKITFGGKKKTKKKKIDPEKIAKEVVSSKIVNHQYEKKLNDYKEYAIFLKRLLKSSDLTIIHREELDFYCRRQNLSDNKALKIEEKIRDELHLSELNWEEEIRRSVQRFFSLHGEVTDIDRIVLYNIYIKKERLLSAQLEQCIAQEAIRNKKQQYSAGIPRALQLIAASVALLTFAVVGLYFRSISSQPGVVEAPQFPKEINVSGSIIEDTVWRSATIYRLTSPVYVEGKACLTIEPGTQILGEFGSALIITQDAEIYARGQQNAPIVFTSAEPKGERQRGDWGGVVLLGNATINQPVGQIEGIAEDDIRGRFGGQDDNSSCGVLEYARIEFGGYEVFADNELNGLTLGGCGRNTIIRNVQVHRAADDGIEMFGGLSDLKNIVITGAKDDSLDWDMGWRGRVQFLVIQQHDDVGDNGFEADNWSKNHGAEPRSNPTMYNVTMIGSANQNSAQRAINLRRGTVGQFNNFVVIGHSKEFLDIRDKSTAELARKGLIEFNHSIIYQIGKDGESYFAVEQGRDNDDDGFQELNFIVGQSGNRLGIDPLLPLAQNTVAPEFTPQADSPLALGAASIPQAEFWDESANYIGALRPGAQSSHWLRLWTDFSEN